MHEQKATRIEEMKTTLERIVSSVLFALLGTSIIWASSLLYHFSDDYRFLQLITVDAFEIHQRITANLEPFSLSPRGVYNYGSNYFSTVLITLGLLDWAGIEANQALITQVSRTVSFGSLMGCILLLGGFIHLKIKSSLFVVAASLLLFLSSEKLWFWGMHIHPDLFQVFLLCSSLVVAFSYQSFRGASAATFLLGLSFGTKYNAGFLLPFIWLPSLFSNWTQSKIAKELLSAQFWIFCLRALIIGSVLFILAWLITNPTVIWNFDEFLADVQHEMKHVGRGHGLEAAKNPLLWLMVFFRDFGAMGSLGICGTAVLGINGFIEISRKSIKKWTHTDRMLVTCMLALAINLIYLMINVNYREPRFAFHLYPLIPIIASIGLGRLRIRKITHSLVLLIAILIVVRLFNSNQLDQRENLNHTSMHLLADKLVDEFTPDTVIYANYYAYIPMNFRNVTFDWFVRAQRADDLEAKVVILSARATQRHTWPQEGTKWRDRVWVLGKTDKAQLVQQHYLQTFFAPNSKWNVHGEHSDWVVLTRKSEE